MARLSSETNRRSFLAKLAGLFSAACAVDALAAGAGAGAGAASGASVTSSTAGAVAATGPFSLPALPYSYDALEPHIDKATMQLHHDKHHAAYVAKLNEAVSGHPDLASKSAEELLLNLNTLPEAIRTAVRNQGGGHVNHTLFWELMTPGGAGNPTGDLATAIRGAFGDFDQFKTRFNDAGTKRFGSGWVWLVKTKDGKLDVISTANQDSPLLDGHQSILGNDLWEHAYYLKYQNRRPEYLAAWWNVVNWDKVAERFAKLS
jgi:Fe-Mn family superoxide dismutase